MKDVHHRKSRSSAFPYSNSALPITSYFDNLFVVVEIMSDEQLELHRIEFNRHRPTLLDRLGNVVTRRRRCDGDRGKSSWDPCPAGISNNHVLPVGLGRHHLYQGEGKLGDVNKF